MTPLIILPHAPVDRADGIGQGCPVLVLVEILTLSVFDDRQEFYILPFLNDKLGNHSHPLSFST